MKLEKHAYGFVPANNALVYFPYLHHMVPTRQELNDTNTTIYIDK